MSHINPDAPTLPPESWVKTLGGVVYEKTDLSIVNSILKLWLSFESMLKYVPIRSIKWISRTIIPLAVPFRDTTYVLNAVGTAKKIGRVFGPNKNRKGDTAITLIKDSFSIGQDILKNIDVARKINFISEKTFHTAVKVIGFGKVIQLPSLAFVVGVALTPVQYIATAFTIMDMSWTIYRDLRPKEDKKTITETKITIEINGEITEGEPHISVTDSRPKISLKKIISLASVLLFGTALVVGSVCVAGQAVLIATLALQFFSALLNVVNHYIKNEAPLPGEAKLIKAFDSFESQVKKIPLGMNRIKQEIAATFRPAPQSAVA